jgi:hypothetical protein
MTAKLLAATIIPTPTNKPQKLYGDRFQPDVVPPAAVVPVKLQWWSNGVSIPTHDVYA